LKIKFHGAAGGEVTGSAYLVQTKDARVLVDCGMFQGGREAAAKNRPPEAARRGKLDAVVVTHGHLDHTGRLPLLAKLGYAGPVYATPATLEMTALILRDSARLQQQDAERQNRRRQRAGEPPLEPLYEPADAEAIIRQFKPVPYQQPVTVAPGVQACWAEAGHMLGSASIQLVVTENGRTKRVVFSGDLGPRGAPILRDFEPFHDADLVFIESTYGDRDHRPFEETVKEYIAVVKDAVQHGGKVLVPTFAIGRAQLLIVLLSWMFRRGKVKPFPAFLDSPMAIEATKIYTSHVELFDDQMRKYMRERLVREDLKTLKATVTADESRAINNCKGPCLVMAGAGMCNAGRILHHLRQNLWKPETHVLIVGYQARGSLGRQLVEGAEFVRIHGEKIAVRAQVHTMGGFSAHAGQTDLLKWFSAIAPSKPRVVVAHGEDGPRQALAKLIQRRHGLRAVLPKLGDVIEI
jgi:metallo-beta-lactamase family protein